MEPMGPWHCLGWCPQMTPVSPRFSLGVLRIGQGTLAAGDASLLCLVESSSLRAKEVARSVKTGVVEVSFSHLGVFPIPS